LWARGDGLRLGLGFYGSWNSFGAEGAGEIALLVLDTFSDEALGGDDEGVALEVQLASCSGAGGFGLEDVVLVEMREATVEEVNLGVDAFEVVLTLDGGNGGHMHSPESLGLQR